MKNVNSLLKEIGVSKVKLAKYLGVSRQMVYNYLEMKSMDEWPKDKKTKLLLLFDVNDVEELANIKPTSEFIMKVESKLEENELEGRDIATTDLKGLNKKNQKVLTDIINLLKERLRKIYI